MLFDFTELIDIIVMTLIVGFIFLRLIQRQGKFEGNMFLFACMVIAPAIIFHEFGHKFMAMFLGYSATFHASYWGLGIGLVLALARSPIIFFIPAYVIPKCGLACIKTPLATALIAFAGPFVNLLLFFVALIVLKTKKDMSQKAFLFWQLTKQINLFLFIFNMIPIRPFDGSQVFSGLAKTFF